MAQSDSFTIFVGSRTIFFGTFRRGTVKGSKFPKGLSDISDTNLRPNSLLRRSCLINTDSTINVTMQVELLRQGNAQTGTPANHTHVVQK